MSTYYKKMADEDMKRNYRNNSALLNIFCFLLGVILMAFVSFCGVFAHWDEDVQLRRQIIELKKEIRTIKEIKTAK